jgi:hypothetical protein
MLRVSATNVVRGLASTRNPVAQDESPEAAGAGERAGISEAGGGDKRVGGPLVVLGHPLQTQAGA